MKKTKVAFMMHGLSLNGIDTVMLNAAVHLNKEKYDVNIIIAIDEDNIQPNEQKAIDAGIKIYRTCDMPGIKAKIRQFHLLKKVLKETGPYDVIHCNMDLLNGLCLNIAKQVRIPIRISHAHTSQPQYLMQNKKNIKNVIHYIYRNVMRRLIRKSATDLCGCSIEANQYINGDAKVTVINNGIELDGFKVFYANRDKLFEKIGIRADKINLVTVGRMVEAKNPVFTVEVMKELVKLNHDANLVWVGTGSMEKQIKMLVEEYNLNENIKFLGTRKDIADILHCCDYFIFPSKFEGLPLALIEAQAAGLDCFISETISDKVDVGKCVVLNLSDGAKKWAEIINEYIKQGNKLELDYEKLKYYDVNYMAGQCEWIYSSI